MAGLKEKIIELASQSNRYRVGDWIEGTNKGAEYYGCIVEIDKNKEFVHRIVGVCVGSMIRNSKDCSGDAIFGIDEWVNFSGECAKTGRNLLEEK